MFKIGFEKTSGLKDIGRKIINAVKSPFAKVKNIKDIPTDIKRTVNKVEQVADEAQDLKKKIDVRSKHLTNAVLGGVGVYTASKLSKIPEDIQRYKYYKSMREKTDGKRQ
jgi:hypothetical protein